MGYRDIEPEEIYTLKKKVLVDVRSPHEFEESHIPGAVNLPLFEDDEKRLIGFVYRTQGVDKAKELGESIAKGKLSLLHRKLKELKERYGNVVVYCWRGGMRSKGLCEAMDRMGLDLLRLKGGYRAYRKFILKDMERLLEGISFIVLTGKTGVGKTRVLKALKERGYPVLDLEAVAKDRGSVFGSVGIPDRVSQKMFDSLLYEIIRDIGSGWVFLEDESRRIGNLHIPEPLWKRKEEGVYVELRASLEVRVRNILEDYTSHGGWKEEALLAVRKIRKYLGEEKYRRVIELFEAQDYGAVVRFLIEEYYDRKYKRFGEPVFEVFCDYPEDCLRELERIYRELSHEGKVKDFAIQGPQKVKKV